MAKFYINQQPYVSIVALYGSWRVANPNVDASLVDNFVSYVQQLTDSPKLCANTMEAGEQQTTAASGIITKKYRCSECDFGNHCEIVSVMSMERLDNNQITYCPYPSSAIAVWQECAADTKEQNGHNAQQPHRACGKLLNAITTYYRRRDGIRKHYNNKRIGKRN